MSKFLHETRKLIENLTKEVEDLKRVNTQISEQNIDLQKQLDKYKDVKKLVNKLKLKEIYIPETDYDDNNIDFDDLCGLVYNINKIIKSLNSIKD